MIYLSGISFYRLGINTHTHRRAHSLFVPHALNLTHLPHINLFSELLDAVPSFWCTPASSLLLWLTDVTDVQIFFPPLRLSSAYKFASGRNEEIRQRRRSVGRHFQSLLSGVVETIMSAETLRRPASTSEGICVLHLHDSLRSSVEGCIT